MTGEIIDIGRGVTGHEKGTRVAVEPITPCNNCPECFNGYYNICANLRHGGGGFAEFMVARTPNVYTLPDSVSAEGGALAEVYAVAVHAVNRAMVSPGDRVAIIGSGPVGLTIAQGGRCRGGNRYRHVGQARGSDTDRTRRGRSRAYQCG